MSWVKTLPLSKVDGQPGVFKLSPRQIAVFNIDGRVFAIDNRCPHEGYPLAEGTVEGGPVVTCNWHNWKFRLADGECLKGGDHVRSYPTRIEAGYIWVDVSDPPPAAIRREILRGLKTAFDEVDFGRICREIARLHYHKLDPRDGVREAFRWAHDRLEFGARHSMAAAADWLLLAQEYSSNLELRLVCLAEAVNHLAWDTLRHAEYPYPTSHRAFDKSGFLEAIEMEQAGVAEAMVVGGLQSGLHWPDMEEAFASAAAAHYNSFGHSLIYVSKAPQLIDALGSDIEPYVLLPLARHLAYTSREDLIPEFKGYQPALESLSEAGESAIGPDLIIPFPISTPDAFAWIAQHLARHTPEQIYDALLCVLAQSMIHFDTSYGVAYDRRLSDNIGWLDFTHGITFSNAVRVVCSRYRALWPQGLLQMACFLGRNAAFLDRDVSEEDWRVSDPGAFFEDTFAQVMDHGFRDPIFSAHLLKTSVAVRSEIGSASRRTAEVLLAGLNRFLRSPLKTKHGRRLARQAIALVARDFDETEPAGVDGSET